MYISLSVITAVFDTFKALFLIPYKKILLILQLFISVGCKIEFIGINLLRMSVLLLFFRQLLGTEEDSSDHVSSGKCS